MNIQEFDPDRIAAVGRLFSDKIDTDPWIMFHGTSQFSSDSIERDGFKYTADLISRNQIQRVANIFETMKWAGEGGGGYPVLKPFSIDHDFRANEHGLLFFAETSLRALLYASRDFAGGEKLRALRIAFSDLDSYLRQPEVRERHEWQMDRSFRSLININAHPSMVEANHQ